MAFASYNRPLKKRKNLYASPKPYLERNSTLPIASNSEIARITASLEVTSADNSTHEFHFMDVNIQRDLTFDITHTNVKGGFDLLPKYHMR